MQRSILSLSLLLLLAGCGGHGGSGTSGDVLSVVSTDVHIDIDGTTIAIYKGSVASSDVGSAPRPVSVMPEVTVGKPGFQVYVQKANYDFVLYDCTYTAGSTTSGKFTFNSATSDYASLKGTSGYFTLTPTLDPSNPTVQSTLRMSPRPIRVP